MCGSRSAVTLAVIIAVAAGASCAHAAFRVGAASIIERDVSGSLDSGQTWDRKTSGDNVYQDEFIHTETESKGQFNLLDSTTIELGPQATMKIDSVVFNPNRSVQKLTVSAQAGAMRWISGNSWSQAYLINTLHATIRPTGTTFDLLVDERRTLVILEAGQIEVCTISIPRRCKTLSRPGDHILATSDDLVGPYRTGPSDFQARCLNAGPPCIITANANPPSPPSKPPGGHRRADRAPTPPVIYQQRDTIVYRVPPYLPPRNPRVYLPPRNPRVYPLH
jgi:FecR protein